ncbi:MAG: hypothetical protein WB493_04795 [Anaeromyxobacteraceae bacterium]
MRVVPPAPPAPGRRPSDRLDGAALFLVAVGLLPVAGQALLGGWSEREVGAGLAIAALAASWVVETARSVRGDPEGPGCPRSIHGRSPGFPPRKSAFPTICRR